MGRYKRLIGNSISLTLLKRSPSFLKGALFFASAYSYCSDFAYTKPLVELKGGYFFFLDSKMGNVYDKGGLDLQLSVSYPLRIWENRGSISAYGSFEFLSRSGHSLYFHQPTSVWIAPLNVGIKPTFFLTKNIISYFSIGPRYFYIHQHNRSSYVQRNLGKNGIGFFVNGGGSIVIEKHLLIDIFGEYSYASIRLKPSITNVYNDLIQVGGFTFGGGIGYAF